MFSEPGERVARANGLDICYEVFGDPAKPAVLLVMGVGAQMLLWEAEFCERFAARGFFVIRFDNRDVGKSSRTDVSPTELLRALLAAGPGERPKPLYRLADMAADALGLLDALNIAKAHLVGLATGGMICQEIALLHPERALSLTTINTSTNEANLTSGRMHLNMLRGFKPPQSAQEYIDAHLEALRVLRGPGYTVDEAHEVGIAEQCQRRGPGFEGAIKQLSALLDEGPRLAKLGRIAAPTLVFHGEKDSFVPVEAGEDTAAAIEDAKLVVVEGMGHFPNRTLWSRLIDEVAGIADRRGSATPAGAPDK